MWLCSHLTLRSPARRFKATKSPLHRCVPDTGHRSATTGWTKKHLHPDFFLKDTHLPGVHLIKRARAPTVCKNHLANNFCKQPSRRTARAHRSAEPHSPYDSSPLQAQHTPGHTHRAAAHRRAILPLAPPLPPPPPHYPGIGLINRTSTRVALAPIRILARHSPLCTATPVLQGPDPVVTGPLTCALLRGTAPHRPACAL